jgi:hypothetical protein
MNQRFSFPVLLIVFFCLPSCGGKKSTSGENIEKPAKDINAIKHSENQTSKNEGSTDTTLLTVRPLIEKGLSQWVTSFKNFQFDSFHQVGISEFQEYEYKEVSDLSEFYTLYKPSLSFSPDSNQFIDLFSNGLSLEKKGKKIIAIGDVDRAVTLCNLRTKNWMTIISFGPSASMEEAFWVSSAKFILAGIMQNDEGKQQPVLLLGNTDEKSFRWFEANFIREESAKFKASGFSKLKIDEWE